MFNRKTEGVPRSEIFYQTAVNHPFFFEPGSFPPLINEEMFKLARLFAEEEALAKEIGDDQLTFGKSTIYRAVTLARKIALAGYPLKMVPLNEILDIAQTFCCYNPKVAEIFQTIALENLYQERRTPESSHKIINYRTTLTSDPDSYTAGSVLVDLLTKLQDTDNSAWTARVVAALAYFSAAPPLQGLSSQVLS